MKTRREVEGPTLLPVAAGRYPYASIPLQVSYIHNIYIINTITYREGNP
jgi:hypothetical protein